MAAFAALSLESSKPVQYLRHGRFARKINPGGQPAQSPRSDLEAA